MAVRNAWAAMAAAVLAVIAAGTAPAAVLVPVKAYVKTDEPVVVQFLNEKGEEGKKAVAQVGLAAVKMEGLFAAAPAGDIVGSNGTPVFSVFTLNGKPVTVGSVKAAADGTVELTGAIPQIKQGGTCLLVWKDATPLVIETLFNPGAGAHELGPVVTHIVPLEYALIKTNKGVIKAKFAYDFAPHTVDNFTSLARQGFYDKSAFHRIISGFMIQGGDAYANIEGKAGMGGPGYQIMQEFSDKRHERGTLSMARAQDPNSAGSQFFIMHAKTTSLDGSYTAFGDVIEGMDIVDAIAKTPVSDSNGTIKGEKPKIESVSILPATAEMYGLKK